MKIMTNDIIPGIKQKQKNFLMACGTGVWAREKTAAVFACDLTAVSVVPCTAASCVCVVAACEI